MDRTFSNVQIKNISEDRREFEGWASTGSRDLQEDELVPEGAVFELPLPILLDHDHTKVVGECYRAEVSRKGIRFWARITKITESGAAKDQEALERVLATANEYTPVGGRARSQGQSKGHRRRNPTSTFESPNTSAREGPQ